MISFYRIPELCCPRKWTRAIQMIDESHPQPKGYKNYLNVWEWQVGGNNGRVNYWGWSPASLCPEVSVSQDEKIRPLVVSGLGPQVCSR